MQQFVSKLNKRTQNTNLIKKTYNFNDKKFIKQSILYTIIAVGTAVISILVRYPIQLLFYNFPPFMLAYGAVSVSTWFGGLNWGIVSLLSYAFISSLLILPMAVFPYVEVLTTLIFIAEGMLIAYIIDQARRSDVVTQYERREQDYIKIIADNQKVIDKANVEIRARDEFLSIASHELKTPLTSMLLQLQAVLNNIQHVSLAKFSVANLLVMLENAEQQTKRLA